MTDTAVKASPAAAPHEGRGSCPEGIRRVVAADHPDRRLAQPATMAQRFLRFDGTHELPHVVETETGALVARFALPGDLAMFLGRDNTDRCFLPADYVRQYTGGQ